MSLSDKNFKALHDFKNSLTNYEEAANGNWNFPAQIIYNYKGKQVKENLEVSLWLNGYDAGIVVITKDGEEINSDKVHVEFNPKFQVYSFTSEGFFKVKGTGSPKIGDYEVTMIPL